MNYDIQTQVLFKPLELIDTNKLSTKTDHPWWNRSLCSVNDCVMRLGVFEKGEFHWHKHDREDEVFFVVEGKLTVDLEGRSVDLEPRQAIMVPRGVMHRTRVDRRTIVLMIEAGTIK